MLVDLCEKDIYFFLCPERILLPHPSYTEANFLAAHRKIENSQGVVMHRKTKLAKAVSAALAATACAGVSHAQDSVLEEVVVSGIRGSLQRNTEIKRNAAGVVDSISAEDIGKFSDTNLAESLQRITGVSIDRSNGEGQSITVRGFGPSFNAVVVNGRRLASESEPRGFSFDTVSNLPG